MNIVPFQEVKKLLNEKITASLLLESFNLHKIPYNLTWINKEDLEQGCTNYAIQFDWDVSKVLVLYGEPPDPEPADAKTEQLVEEVMGGLGLLNNKQCICMLFQDMTLESLVAKINQISNMKAFI